MPQNPAIIIAAWNRPESLRRLLRFLERGFFSENQEVPLVFALDYEKSGGVKKVAEEFVWKYGPKKLHFWPERVGLKQNLEFCAAQSLEYGSAIILEDDLGLSPHFYEYAQKALQFYASDSQICGISLYSHQMAESNAFYPFHPLIKDDPVYFLQYPVSWGWCLTGEMWQAYQEYEIPAGFPEPSFLKGWSKESWKRHYLQYMRSSGKYFVCPSGSYSTNFGDPGVHFEKQDSRFQVPLEIQPAEPEFVRFKDSQNRHDAWFEPESAALKSMIPALAAFDFEVDFYGSKRLEGDRKKDWLLTTQPTKNPEKSWGRFLRPLWQNILFEQQGKGIFLTRSKNLQPLSRKESLALYMDLHQYYYSLPELRSRLVHWWIRKMDGGS